MNQSDTDLDGVSLDHAGIPSCPFCNGNARYFGPLEDNRFHWEIQCRACGASVQASGDTNEKAKRAVFAKWSQRTADYIGHDGEGQAIAVWRVNEGDVIVTSGGQCLTWRLNQWFVVESAGIASTPPTRETSR